MFKIFDLFKPKPRPIPEPVPVIQTYQTPFELILLDSQLETASDEHAELAMKWYLQLIVDGLPNTTAAKQTSFKFFGSYRNE